MKIKKAKLKKVTASVDYDTEIYALLKKEYPKVTKQVVKIASAMGFDVYPAMSFCLLLLEEVNAHDEMAQVKKIFAASYKKNMAE